MHQKATPGGVPTPLPTPPLLAGAAIGLTILGMATSAMAFGAGLALSKPSVRGK